MRAFFAAIVEEEGAKCCAPPPPDLSLPPFDQIKAGREVYIDRAEHFPDGYEWPTRLLSPTATCAPPSIATPRRGIRRKRIRGLPVNSRLFIRCRREAGSGGTYRDWRVSCLR
jgi:hypothetical protein